MVWLAAARTSVRPSGTDFATSAAPVVPPARGRFSTITLPPSAVPSSGPMARARMSGPPPAANGTMMRVTPPEVCAPASAAASARSIARSARFIEPSDTAPVADQLLVDRNRLADALHAAVFVGLVRELRLARTQHYRRRARVDLEQVARIGVVRRGLRARPRAEVPAADLEHPLHPFFLGLGPDRVPVDAYFQLGFFPSM